MSRTATLQSDLAAMTLENTRLRAQFEVRTRELAARNKKSPSHSDTARPPSMCRM